MVIKDIVCDGNSLPIQEFKLEWMVPNPSICMIAKRGSGKSWICKSILKHFSNIPGGVIIAPTDKMNCFYGKFFPDTYIHYEYTTDIIEKILHRQEKIIQKCKEKFNKGKKCDPRAFLIMDDCLSSKGSWMKDQPIMKLFFDGRHYQIMYIMTMQFPLGIKPELRCNFDYIFLLAEDFYSQQKRLYDHYAGMFPNFNAFRQVFVEITSDWGSMVIVNRGARKTFLEKVFWYKADDNEDIDIGCKQFNKYHKDNYDENWRTRDKVFDIEEYVQTKNKSKLNVTKQKSS